jgi:parallel beta-helix repeat protein
VSLQVSNGNRIIRNQLRSNPSGVELDSSTQNRIAYNDASGSGGSGITLENSGDNDVVFNTANGNGANGIYVKGASESYLFDNVVQGNTANDNKAKGIFVENPWTTVTGNFAYRNASWGMYAMPGVTDGGGNHAGANGEGAQCLIISCLP